MAANEQAFLFPSPSPSSVFFFSRILLQLPHPLHFIHLLRRLTESWSHPWTCFRRFPGGIHCLLRAFLARLFEVPMNSFQSSYGCTWKKKNQFYLQGKVELVLLPFNCRSKRQIGIVWNWLKTCNELTRQRHKLWQLWRFSSRKYCEPFQVDFSQTSENLNKWTSLSYVWDWGLPVDKVWRNWILSCVHDFFNPYWHLLLMSLRSTTKYSWTYRLVLLVDLLSRKNSSRQV